MYVVTCCLGERSANVLRCWPNLCIR